MSYWWNNDLKIYCNISKKYVLIMVLNIMILIALLSIIKNDWKPKSIQDDFIM